MEREKIKLTNSQWENIVNENYLEINGEEIPIKQVQNNYDGSGRHTEMHHIIFQRLFDNKYFRVDFETSVKDTMGWKECNYGGTEAIEVFPQEETVIIYK